MSRDSKAIDVLSIGLNSADTLIRLPRFPTLDSKVPVLSSNILAGGQAASAAVACHRWGLRTRYVGKIGDDWAGRFQRDELAREGMKVRWIEVPGCASQAAYILVDQPSGERTVLWQHDPRLDLREDDLPRDWIAQTRLLHVDGHPPTPATVAARWAREAGAIVTADLDNLYPGVEELLPFVDYLMTSREFPSRLTGIADTVEALLELHRRFPCRLTGATLGRDGALAWDGASFHYSPAFEIDAVDTTGAGDIFHAGFAYALLEGKEIPEALNFACAAAGLSCTAMGARGGIQPLTEIHRLMREGQRHANSFDGRRLRLASTTSGN